MEISQVSSTKQLNDIKTLFREYFAWIDRELKFDMSYQSIEGELSSLPGAFSPPAGCLLIAERGAEAICKV
jgi:hypothetical protein